MTWRQSLKNAFAVEADTPAAPTEAQQAPVEWVCRQIATRRLTTPGLLALEMCRPLNYILAQCMHFTEPGVWAVSSAAFLDHYKNFASFLEQRGSFDYLCRRIEQIEAERSAKNNGPS